MEERIEALRTQLKQVQGTKTRLEHQMDNLVVTDAHYNKKISDLQRRYDEQYDKAEIVETQMDEWNSRLLSVRQEIKERCLIMYEKVNPAHPDKIAGRIVGALVDLAYAKEENPRM